LKDAAIPDSELLKKRGDFAAFLLRLGQAKEAHDLYVSLTALSPREARYRLGQARAAAALGATEEATRQYRRFLDLWRKADAGLPVLEEAREHIHSQEGGNEEP
jgi:Flp pilus assembly protein TadD